MPAQIVQTYRTFGDSELQQLRKKVLENRELLLKVKAMQAAQAQHAEQNMLSALRETVDHMEDIKQQASNDSKSAQQTLQSLQQVEEVRMKLEERHRAAEILSKIDLGKLLDSMGKDPKVTASSLELNTSDECDTATKPKTNK